MGWFKKKSDPISDRARALNAEIEELEAKIRKLDAQLQEPDARRGAGLRSTALPDGRTIRHALETGPEVAAREPVFEDVDQARLQARSDIESPEHYNELGVRKYDLPALFRRIANHLHGPAASNPKLVNYLAAGGIQGLRPLRYEKRVARNRFIFFVVLLFLSLLGVMLWFAHHR